MKDKIRICLILMAMLPVSFVKAQEKKLLSLKEAIDLSIKNSKQLKISNAKIEEANAALKESENRKLPDASISGSYLRLGTANIDVKKQNNNNGGNNGESPKVSQAAYG